MNFEFNICIERCNQCDNMSDVESGLCVECRVLKRRKEDEIFDEMYGHKIDNVKKDITKTTNPTKHDRISTENSITNSAKQVEEPQVKNQSNNIYTIFNNIFGKKIF